MKYNPVAVAIRDHLIVKSCTVDDALSRACSDLYAAHRRIWDLEAALAAAHRDQSHGYHRRGPEHPARQPEPVPASIDDGWIATAREA